MRGNLPDTEVVAAFTVGDRSLPGRDVLVLRAGAVIKEQEQEQEQEQEPEPEQEQAPV